LFGVNAHDKPSFRVDDFFRQRSAVILLIDLVQLAVLQVGCDPFVELGQQFQLVLLYPDREVENADRDLRLEC
jgi:hypothetical protein